MRVPYSWLQEYVAHAPSLEQAVELLTMSGTKVEAVHSFGVPNASAVNGGFRVGRVVSFEQHPNADRLRVCRVDVGDSEPRQIVCGASNFAAGDTVAVVLPGAVMPGGHTIGEAKLRGVESSGMMLSERELELSSDHDGIMLLPKDWAPGQSLSERFPIGDDVIEFEITSNRPDCLGVAGIARELAVASRTALTDPFIGEDAAPAAGAPAVQDMVSVTVEAGDLCPRYMARGFVDVQVGESPHWLKSRLAAAGMRSINTVVDVTNYVMLLTGQPLHAFDADKLAGNTIAVRRARDGEKVTTLDGVERSLEPWMLSIADADSTVVIAGVFGAESAEVSTTTTRIVLESACFNGPGILRTSSHLGLRTESSTRFEKGLDPILPEVALRLASRMLQELAGAQMASGTIDVQSAALPKPNIVQMESEFPSRIIGAEITPREITEILEGLGCIVHAAAAGDDVVNSWNVEVPHWRAGDITRAIDLVEEVARLIPGERIPATMPSRRTAPAGGLTRKQRLIRVLEDAGAGLGFHETVTYALAASGDGVRFGCDPEDVIAVTNPMTIEHAELRCLLVPSLLDVARRNRTVGTDNIALFENARTFRRATPGAVSDVGLPLYAQERQVLGILASGMFSGGYLGADPVPVTFATCAGRVQAWLAAAGITTRLQPMENPGPLMHPGQAATLVDERDGRSIGWLATVHPQLVRDAGLRHDAVGAEIDLDAALVDEPHTLYTPVGNFPPVLQDLAVIVPDTVLAGSIVDVARKAGGALLENVEIFDRYAGAGIESGHHSIAVRVTLRAAERTLTDADATQVRESIATALHEQLGAQLRDR